MRASCYADVVIVVVGSAALLSDPADGGRAVGLAPEIAAAAAACGSAVELVTKAGEDAAGEELLLALARAGVGHLAVLRDAGHATAIAPQPAMTDEEGVEDEIDLVPALLAEEPAAAVALRHPGVAASAMGPILEPADLSLGLRYLRDYAVVVAVEPLADGVAAVIAEAASYADAPLVVVAAPDGRPDASYAGATTVVEAPPEDPDGAFAALVGRYAAALDSGVAPAEAFASATALGGWEPAAG